ncbi:helix-turn-helix transcriptional regulator [Meiothermus sp.]|uniref:helix-turn-helix transcriptional regulator n=1 Tax=Meiothermus sp. TaxID=1955249 RepID=UPI00307E9EBF
MLPTNSQQAQDLLHNPAALRRLLLDPSRRTLPRSMLDCGAHMILYATEVSEILQMGLSYLTHTLDAVRCDAGFGHPHDQVFVSTQQYIHTDYFAHNVVGLPLPNQHALVQTVWYSTQPCYFNIAQDPAYADVRQTEALQDSWVVLVRRMEVSGVPFGILCVDDTLRLREWSPRQHWLFEQFIITMLSPLCYLNRLSHGHPRTKPTGAELEVIAWSAQGYSYAEIAEHLGKSVRTVRNQLASAREKLGARNQVELIRLCRVWLEEFDLKRLVDVKELIKVCTPTNSH